MLHPDFGDIGPKAELKAFFFEPVKPNAPDCVNWCRKLPEMRLLRLKADVSREGGG